MSTKIETLSMNPSEISFLFADLQPTIDVLHPAISFGHTGGSAAGCFRDPVFH